MIDAVIESLLPARPDRFIFVCRSEHVARYDLRRSFAARTASSSVVVETAALTRGPASSALLAAPIVDSDDELLISYSDGYMPGTDDFLRFSRRSGADGALVTYPSSNPAFSYALADKSGRVLRTAEKERISPHATVGLYYFRRGGDFIAAAHRMIANDPDRGGEFFVCPVFNELIADGQMVVAYPVAADAKVELGTPEDLMRFQARRVESKADA
jgi:dTDP-glucose pyrophosphorylase